uniref:Uncharacterized protein n=1 Tax=Rhizophora mucronata TaxID=61149 RepID=A0A2P2NEB9_RHIMU
MRESPGIEHCPLSSHRSLG